MPLAAAAPKSASAAIATPANSKQAAAKATSASPVKPPPPPPPAAPAKTTKPAADRPLAKAPNPAVTQKASQPLSKPSAPAAGHALPGLPPVPSTANTPASTAHATSGGASSPAAPKLSVPSASPGSATHNPMSRGNAALALDPARQAPQIDPTPTPEPASAETVAEAEPEARRAARRRPAAPPREQIAANDDLPSIGGLIFALNQRPSNRPFAYAAAGSGFWLVLATAFAVAFAPGSLSFTNGLTGILASPWFPTFIATLAGPIALFWFLALLAWRTEELHMRSTAMTEVAVRLAEPDRMAEQSVASLGQAVRRQVSFMNDAVSRALGRAGELEALVHTEVSALELSYEENERRIRGLINELANERHALVNTGDHFHTSLEKLGVEIPELIEKLSDQQLKLTTIISGASENLGQLEGALAHQTGRFETTLGDRTTHLQSVLTDYTQALGTTLEGRTNDLQTVLMDYTDALGQALGQRSNSMETMLGGYTEALGSALTSRSSQLKGMLEDQRKAIEGNVDSLHASIGDNVGKFRESVDQKVNELEKAVDTNTTRINETLSKRTETLQTVFEEYALALDTTLANRAEALDSQLVERTKSLDEAFSERLRLFDESVLRSTMAIDNAVGENTKSLTGAMEEHARQLSDSISAQASEMDESLMRGLQSVRETSENISRQSIKAIEGLASQSDLLRNVSENLLQQINGVTTRFENQGQSIMRSANALETTNYKIEKSLAGRTEELNHTLDRMSGKAEELSRVVEGYSTSLEGSLSEAEQRARMIAEEISRETESRSRSALDDLQRVKSEATRETDRALEELRSEFNNVSREVTQRLGDLTTQFSDATGAVRDQAAAAARDLQQEQARLKQELDRLPAATEQTAGQMRRALSDQLRALDKLSTLANRTQVQEVAGRTSSGNRLLPPSRENRSGLSSLSQAARDAATGRNTPQQQDSWSLGDLLARASDTGDTPPSRPAAPQQRSPAPPPARQPVPDTPTQAAPAGGGSVGLDIAALSRALDATTAASIWSRFRAGQRGFMVRSIYAPESRNMFDGIARRYQGDENFRHLVNRFLDEFEREIGDADQFDSSGATSRQMVTSDTGRVYLVLAHASNRLQ